MSIILRHASTYYVYQAESILEKRELQNKMISSMMELILEKVQNIDIFTIIDSKIKKGICSLPAELEEISEKFKSSISQQDFSFAKFYYCIRKIDLHMLNLIDQIRLANENPRDQTSGAIMGSLIEIYKMLNMLDDLKN